MRKFKIGDQVRITRNSHVSDEDFDYSYFDKYVGRETCIVKLNGSNTDGEPCYYTSIDFEDGYLNSSLSVCETDIEFI
jgi:hypothetical protein